MNQQEYLEQEGKWLREYRDAYTEAIENLSNIDYVRGLLRGIAVKFENLLAYNPNESPEHAAPFIIGEVQAKMEKTLTDLEFIDQYEDRRKEYDEVFTTVESQDEGSHSGQPESTNEL